jgi:hypothetical protein
MNRIFLVVVWAALVGGCNLVDISTLSVNYAFDAQHYMQKFGDASSAPAVPTVACDPTAMGAGDPCAAAQARLPAGYNATLACDAKSKQCVASAELRLLYTVDLTKAQTPLPSEVIQYGINSVTLQKVAYWVVMNSLNVTIPPIDLYVAPQAAKDETMGTRLGTIGMLPAGAKACTDPVDGKGDPDAQGATVCDLPLTSDGTGALQDAIKNYKTAPFQIIAHTKVSAKGGEPLPGGAIDFYVRPTVNIGILK